MKLQAVALAFLVSTLVESKPQETPAAEVEPPAKPTRADINDRLIEFQALLGNSTNERQDCVISYDNLFLDKYNVSEIEFFYRTSEGDIDVEDTFTFWNQMTPTCQNEIDAFAALLIGKDLNIEVDAGIVERFDKALETQTDKCKACLEASAADLMASLGVDRGTYITRYFTGRISNIRLLTTLRKMEEGCNQCIQDFFNPVQEEEKKEVEEKEKETEKELKN